MGLGSRVYIFLFESRDWGCGALTALNMGPSGTSSGERERARERGPERERESYGRLSKLWCFFSCP